MTLRSRKYVFSLMALIFCHISLKAQPHWNWVKTIQEDGFSVRGDIATGPGSDIYVTGTFTGKIVFDNHQTLTSAGGQDIFLAKYNIGGQLLWVRSAGGMDNDIANAVATDAQGNVFIGGSFKDVALFDTVTLTSAGRKDAFFAKYGSDGALKWAKRAGGIYDDQIGSGIGSGGIATDPLGNILMTGMFSDYGGSPAIFGTALFDTTVLTSHGNADVFVAKYNTEGNVIWAHNGGGRSSDLGFSIASDTMGNVIVVGGYDTITDVYFDTFKLNGLGYSDVFVARYNPDGQLLWAESGGGASVDDGRSVTAGPSGNIYVTGSSYSPTLEFGPYTINSRGQEEMFLTCYDTAGNVLWSKTAGWWGSDLGMGIASDRDENIYVTGMFNVACIFDNDSVRGHGGDDAYVAKYDRQGNLAWALSAGGPWGERAHGIALDESGNVIITGNTGSNTLYFDPYVMNTSPSIFVARLNLFPVGVDKKNVRHVMITPNPTENLLQVANVQNADYIIQDITGRVIQSGIITETNNKIDVHSLVTGMYLLQLSTKREQHTMKFMKL